MLLIRAILLCLGVTFVAPGLFATDSDPVMKTKLCNPAETYCTDVTSGLRAKVDSDVTSSILPTGASTSANQSIEITSLQLLDDVPSGANASFSKGEPIMGQLDDVSTTAATENNLMPARITAQRALHVILKDNAGTDLGTSGNPVYTNSTASITTTDANFSNIYKQNEISVATKTESDLSTVTYTVPSGKKFALCSLSGSYDIQSPLALRFKKQTGGSGSFATIFKITLETSGQDSSNYGIPLAKCVLVGAQTDVFKVTYESALSKGTLWAGFSGIEY